MPFKSLWGRKFLYGRWTVWKRSARKPQRSPLAKRNQVALRKVAAAAMRMMRRKQGNPARNPSRSQTKKHQGKPTKRTTRRFELRPPRGAPHVTPTMKGMPPLSDSGTTYRRSLKFLSANQHKNNSGSDTRLSKGSLFYFQLLLKICIIQQHFTPRISSDRDSAGR